LLVLLGGEHRVGTGSGRSAGKKRCCDELTLHGKGYALELFFPVTDMLPAKAAVLLLLELVRSLETLVRRVVAVSALGALEEDVAFLDLHDWVFLAGGLG
jgi:hypothetical protein